MSEPCPNSIVALYVPADIDKESFYVCIDSQRTNAEIEQEMMRIVLGLPKSQSPRFYAAGKPVSAAHYHVDGAPPESVLYSVSSRNSSMHNQRAEFFAGFHSAKWANIFGACLFATKLMIPASMLLDGQVMYASVTGVQENFEKYFGPVRFGRLSDWVGQDDVGERASRRVRNNWDFDNSEYLAGPEPNPYDGTYSEE
tara:strand:+ start:2540 stop:3133 length:594 start_codon:yes stop_codon:yes gene_type:complete